MWNFDSSIAGNGSVQGPSVVDICPASFVTFMSLLHTYVLTNDKISGINERVKPVEEPLGEYDFIVIGGGAGGCAVASRLSENPDWKVLLLEAGGDESSDMQIPSFAFAFLSSQDIWPFVTTNEKNACLSTNGSCAWPSGKNLAGNTAHNAMVYLRGHPKDYDNWANLGNEGWTWEEVEPFFIEGEDNGEIERVGRKHHGTGGPLSVERLPYAPPLSYSILDAAIEKGYGVSEDLNGDVRTGFSITQSTNKKGVRRSSAAAYLWPNRDRKNLHISLNSFVTKVIIQNDTAVGVEYYKDGKKNEVKVTREVIVSGGTVKSPHVLLTSGIGPKEHLESMGVEVIKDLPGVGENLHDHPTPLIPFTVNEPDVYDNDWAVTEEYSTSQTGPLASTGTIQSLGLIASNKTTSDYPDLEIYFQGYIPGCAPGAIGALQSEGKRIVNVCPSLLRPKSKGRITLASNDPFDVPNIWANYLGEAEDVDVLVEGIKHILNLIQAEAFRSYNFTIVDAPLEACSNYEFLSDEYWSCVVKQNIFIIYHWAGTCKMGPSSDPKAVVDHRLRVHGIKGLRVADASIMPEVVSANTQAATMMIGERAAHFINEDWGSDVEASKSPRPNIKSKDMIKMTSSKLNTQQI